MSKFEVTAEQILTSDNKYPDRLLEATSDIIHNCEVLALLLTDLLEHYGRRPAITSGYRTAEANKAAGGAKLSNHQLGLACDFADPKGEFDKWCMSNTGVLASIGLYLEHPDSTPSWTHLQSKAPRSGRIVFKP